MYRAIYLDKKARAWVNGRLTCRIANLHALGEGGPEQQSGQGEDVREFHDVVGIERGARFGVDEAIERDITLTGILLTYPLHLWEYLFAKRGQ